MQPGSTLFCATPVENLFIEEYLPQAPAEYVKVYLTLLPVHSRPLAIKYIH